MKHVVVGVALMGLGVWGMVAWWESFAYVMRGLVPFGLLAVGLVALLSGYSRTADADQVEDEESLTR